MKKLVEYPAIFRKDNENPVYINVSFPDILAGNTFGEGMEDAMYMAKDLLKMMLEDIPEQCMPPHSLEETQKNFPNEEILMVRVEIDK